ncbi:MAG: UDP-N-acetylglucosamine--N-acetylmuramyl-(pentapeptide) pyrophosphoryl-undecaprenol N-acetylglucosamine transferase, partial [Gemmatimonadales bacterium]
EADPGIEPFFVGAQRGIEARVLPQRPWRHVLLPMEPIYRRQWWKNVRLPWSVYRTLRELRRVLVRENPVLAIGTGGYVSGPALWAAALRGIPTVIQEQNAFPGFATRRLARKARQIHLGFPEARAYLRPGPNTEIFDSGNPIAPPGARREARVAKESLGFEQDRPLVLVVGGSQGALGINRAVAQALESEAWPVGVQLLWQTGAQTFSDFSQYATRASRLAPFIDPIAPAYQAADLVVARAGAVTLAELAAWGLPAILVPLPTAAADHQLINARALAEGGAAVLLEQQGLTGRTLSGVVRDLLKHPAKMADLSRSIGARARPDAAREIAHEALRLVSKK